MNEDNRVMEHKKDNKLLIIILVIIIILLGGYLLYDKVIKNYINNTSNDSQASENNDNNTTNIDNSDTDSIINDVNVYPKIINVDAKEVNKKISVLPITFSWMFLNYYTYNSSSTYIPLEMMNGEDIISKEADKFKLAWALANNDDSINKISDYYEITGYFGINREVFEAYYKKLFNSSMPENFTDVTTYGTTFKVDNGNITGDFYSGWTVLPEVYKCNSFIQTSDNEYTLNIDSLSFRDEKANATDDIFNYNDYNVTTYLEKDISYMIKINLTKINNDYYIKSITATKK